MISDASRQLQSFLIVANKSRISSNRSTALYNGHGVNAETHITIIIKTIIILILFYFFNNNYYYYHNYIFIYIFVIIKISIKIGVSYLSRCSVKLL